MNEFDRLVNTRVAWLIHLKRTHAIACRSTVSMLQILTHWLLLPRRVSTELHFHAAALRMAIKKKQLGSRLRQETLEVLLPPPIRE